MNKKIQRIAAVTIMAGLLLAGCGGNAKQADAVPAVEPSAEWAAKLGDEQGTDQILIVAGIGETTATVSMHEKDGDGNWSRIMSTPGYIGKYGLGKTKEGDGMSPVGAFHFTHAFGIASDPGCKAFKYQQVDDDAYWSGDVNFHYNEMVDIDDYPELAVDDSEHIIEYTIPYQYAMNISYNEEGTPGLGSAIFLHCLGGEKPYTGGCVAIPQDKMIFVLKNVREDCAVVIDDIHNIAPELVEEWGL